MENMNLYELAGILIPLITWELTWKGIALWKCAKNNQKAWFVAIFLLNTAGILPLTYLKLYKHEKNK